ncbi:MAG: hypothetical protein IJ318_00385 [Clostridia bacterium]|nr:hypothetical protein [Clostridia bacterium]
MKFNNSIKLAIANFALFWKLLLYVIIATALSALFILPVSHVLGECFSASGFFDAFLGLFSMPLFQGVESLLAQLLSIFNTLFAGLHYLMSTNLFVFIYLAIIVLIVIPFLFKLSDVPASESAYSYMSSLNKNSFSINFVNLLGKSSGYAIFRSALEIPFWFALIGGVYGLLNLSQMGDVWVVVAPLLLFVYIILLFDLDVALFSGWAPSIVVFNCCAGKGLKKGLKAVKRNFFSVLSSFAVSIAIVVCLTYLFNIYALVFALPFMSLIVAVFGNVLFFESQGMDYYLSPDKIVTPRKLETADSIKKVKMIV